MKRILLPLFISGLLFTGVGFSQSNKQIPVFTVPTPNLGAIQKEDEERAKQGIMYRTGMYLPVQMDIYNNGVWFNDGQGTLVYQIEIESPGAKGLNVLFDEFILPEKAELRIYSPVTNQLVGPYTSEHNINQDFIVSGNILGERLIVEIAVPEEAVGELKIHINEIGYFYRNANPMDVLNAKNLGDSDPCEVNAACSEGASWTNQRRGIAMVQVKDGPFIGSCSGSILSNTSDDCTPYFLLAQHCGAGASAADFRSWVFYFEYESSGCSDPGSEPTTQNVTGSLKCATSGDVSDIDKSDFLLVLMKNRPSVAANAYYNGWNRNNTTSSSGVGIHHPAADIKKISTYATNLSSSTWDGTPNTHWRVYWVATANGHGVTEGGSSGSPIFNSAGLVIGDLSGGSSLCTSPTLPDLYGKFSYSWNSCGATANRQLEPWLDRTAVGSTTLTGKDNTTCAAAAMPVVDFTANSLYPLVSTEVVTLTDATTNSPFMWQWSFVGPGVPTYVGGTSSTSQNPQVTFPVVGNYSVILYSGNSSGYASKSRASYIHVGNIGIEGEDLNPIKIYPNPASNMIYVNLGTNIWNLDNTSITMMDLSGKFVLIQKINTSNANIISVNIPESIASGFYFVKVTDGVNEKVQKLEITK